MRLALAIVALSPTLAMAHTGAGDTMGFLHGFEHPLGGLDHVLAMLAVGVLAAVLGGRALWLLPLSFMSVMLLGFALGLMQVELPLVELGIALSSVAIGLGAMAGRPLPLAAAMALVGVFAVFHGHAHGAEMPATTEGLGYVAGFLAATALLHLAGLAGTMGLVRLAGQHARLISRLAGGVIALGGVGVLAGWL
ncbi:HupE/UreJ family protein [Devosia beringensis]|uniref:HupE/UreJ family protein n=1 Tax=Devosia beringensis TaxID=2657486 RepID=UPI00186B6C20|nr:HupE/UreJ family protein [Devosia beringensis]